jgi:hypothetical protein
LILPAVAVLIWGHHSYTFAVLFEARKSSFAANGKKASKYGRKSNSEKEALCLMLFR